MQILLCANIICSCQRNYKQNSVPGTLEKHQKHLESKPAVICGLTLICDFSAEVVPKNFPAGINKVSHYIESPGPDSSTSALLFLALLQKKDVRMLRFIQEVNTTTRSCALWDLDEDTEYILHVQSISMGGSSPPSEPVLFRTPKESEKMASKSPGEGR